MPSTSSASTEDQHHTPGSERKRTPSTAVIDFDNHVTMVRANNIRGGRVTRGCLSFVLHCAALLIVGVVGLVMAIISGWGTSSFNFWISLFTLSVGGFLPNPKIENTPESNDPLPTIASALASNATAEGRT